MLKKQKGITLVALVVTIVVLLILAGVSINLVLGDNGIVKKAQEAKRKSGEASQNDLTSMNELAKELEDVIDGTGNNDNESKFMKENTKVTYPDGDVWIPEGFKIAEDSALTVQGGVVIEDKDGNQFVWVPVATIADYKRTAYSTNIETEETDTTTNSVKIKHNSDDDYYFTEALPEDEKTSVDTYKGFYIGRYEAGDKESTEAKTLRSSADATKTVTIKANQAPYNLVTRAQAISLAEGFATKQVYKAKTKLVSSYAWDTTIEFIQKVNSDYGSSTPQGNYADTKITYVDITGTSQTKAAKPSAVLVPTGQTTPVCNIYDMGGNVWEWTTELCSDINGVYSNRGGTYQGFYAEHPAGLRDRYSDISSDLGFRIALFID